MALVFTGKETADFQLPRQLLCFEEVQTHLLLSLEDGPFPQPSYPNPPVAAGAQLPFSTELWRLAHNPRPERC